jgi:hypothetical protein
MADAQVRDLERLEHFLHQLHGFQERLTKQSDESRIELARATRWIEQEAPDYWRQQDQLARRRWVEAREALLRCEAVTRADDKPACSELRKKLDICTQRVKLCEYKLRQAKQFQLTWQQELQAIQTKIQHRSPSPGQVARTTSALRGHGCTEFTNSTIYVLDRWS